MSRTPSKDAPPGPPPGPFRLDDERAYARWRAHKLGAYPRSLEAQRVPVARPGHLTPLERTRLVGACRRANFAIYRTDPQNSLTREELRSFGEQLGLVCLDRHLWAPEEGIAALRKEEGGPRARYIPYTDRPMQWHTDGYYNAPDSPVRGVIMHCVRPAADGGASYLLDPEMVYMEMRDANPAFVEALMQPDVMSIPENTQEPGARRPAVSGPVFSVDAADGVLHMRYTARTRSIVWKGDACTREAVACLEVLLTPPVSHAFRVRLDAGEGIVCNNVLHGREGYTDDPDPDRCRLLWRARYRERIGDTSAPRDGSPWQRASDRCRS